VGLLRLTGLFDLWELKTLDERTRWTLPSQDAPPARPEIFYVFVTDESLQLVEQNAGGMTWPWDRELYALFIKACAAGKATAVLMDVLLQEAGPDEEELVKALAQAPPTYLAAAFWRGTSSRPLKRPDEADLLKKFAVDVDNDGSVAFEEPFEHAYFPSAGIAKAVTGVCDISSPRDRDGMMRRYRLLSRFRGRHYPSMALAALMAREQVRSVRVRNRVMTVGTLSFPVEPEGMVWLRYYRPGSWYRWRSAWNVINAMAPGDAGLPRTFDPKELEGKTVIFGVSASGLTDLRLTPVQEQPVPGPEIHGMALANILNGEFLRQVPKGVSVLAFVLVAVAVALVTRYSSALLGGAAAAAALLAAIGTSVLLYRARWGIELVPQLAAGMLSYAATSAVNFLYEGRQRLRTKREFQRYFSPRVVDKILNDPDALSLAGERKTITLFFLDFAGFTSMSEKLDPAELVRLINEYHNEAAEEIFRTEGTLDKYIGDAIMAFWNDPIRQPDHALRACLSAVAAQRRLREMAAQMKERGLPEMSARIGIHTGVATVGNMGARRQVSYTAIGDEVNLASRLEGVNKEFGTDIIVSEAAYEPAADRLEARELAFIKVKGKKKPVKIYELLGVRGEVPAERLERARRFEKALAEFRARQFEKARESFRELAEGGDDRAADAYLGLCDRYLAEPPPEDWDGFYQMEHK